MRPWSQPCTRGVPLLRNFANPHIKESPELIEFGALPANRSHPPGIYLRFLEFA
ncbi:hypothetical protein B382_10881 [Stutzerimonas stutzeri B1SMN1]|nr:hypothetical protein B382_10881 [Stutzerimonas stutzeri B1SMN1]